MLLFLVTLALTVVRWYNYSPEINFENFDDGLKTYAYISSMHSFDDITLIEFAKMSTTNILQDSSAYDAMHWLNSRIYRSSTTRVPPRSWKHNPCWTYGLGSLDGYRLLHVSYHMFDKMRCPHPPILYIYKSRRCVLPLCEFDRMYTKYVKRMNMYKQSRQIIVKLRALMNIIHFGSFVNEGNKCARDDRVLHRSALLEVLKESEKQPRSSDSLKIEVSIIDNRLVYSYKNEPMWR